MPGRMAPCKKPRSTTKLPLALNPMKSKDVLAVLAERNQAIVPVGAWVEPASPNSSEIPAYTSAYIIEEELKEQLRKKQEALKHFQRQVKHRVNQQIRLKKKHQLQKSFEAAEKEGSIAIAMQSSDPAFLTPKKTSVFPSNFNVAIGNFTLPSSQLLEVAVEDGENQNELFQQQAQALSQTMKEARHRLASHKTEALSRKPAFIKINLETSKEFPLKIHQGLLTTTSNQKFMENQEDDFEDASSLIREEKGREDLFGGTTQDIVPEDKDKPYSRVQKVKFKNPLFVVMEEEEEHQSCFQSLPDIPPKAHDFLPEAQCDLPETQADLIEVKSIEPAVQSVEPDTQAIVLEVQSTEPECQTIEPEVQAVKTETQDIILKTQSFEVGGGTIEMEAQNFLSPNQDLLLKDQDSLPEHHCILPKDQNILPNYQDQNFLPRNHYVLPKEQQILLKYQDQDFLPEDQDLLSKDQCVLPKEHNAVHKCQELHFQPKDQKNYFCQPSSALTAERWKKEWPTNSKPCLLHSFQDQTAIRDQLEQKEEGDQQEKANLKQPASTLVDRRGREDLPLDFHQDPICRDYQASISSKKVHFKEPFSDVTDEKGREDLPLGDYQYLLSKSQFQDFIREQIEQNNKEHRDYGQASYDKSDERWRKKFFPECRGYDLHEVQDPTSAREQSLYFRRQPSVRMAERRQEVLLLDSHQHVPSRIQRETCRRKVYDEHQSGLRTEFQMPLAFQSGVDKEEDKKERQKQYLRHRRLFMDIEREQVKEQKRQKEQKKKIEKIKKKKEQQRYAEEQRIIRMNVNEESYSGEKMSEILAQLQLEELKVIREKQQQRERERIRYVEALRAQVQEKMQLYNITLPPLCCCGPDFWDAHPDTCANNCIFYKNHKAYNRALQSVINSSDISEGNSTLRSAIRNFAYAHRRILKNLY